jgi:uncharacterized protein
MKVVVIGERSGATMETIMSVYPRHKIVVDKFIERGDVVGIGPFNGAEIWQFLKPARPPNNL